MVEKLDCNAPKDQTKKKESNEFCKSWASIMNIEGCDCIKWNLAHCIAKQFLGAYRIFLHMYLDPKEGRLFLNETMPQAFKNAVILH